MIPLRGIGLALVFLAVACGAGPERAAPPAEAARSDGIEELSAFLRCADEPPAIGRSAARPTDPPRSGSPVPAECVRGAYLWSPAMPLSEDGRAEAVAAAAELGVRVRPVEASVLEGSLEAHGGTPRDELVVDLIGSGATLHYPALVLYRAGARLGPAILGYKTAEAYGRLLSERLAGGLQVPSGAPPAVGRATARALVQEAVDHEVPGRPGAYFRWVPGTRSVAYEAGGQVFLLDLDSGQRSRAPGVIDFVPTPDGRLFVTPGRARTGLDFYDASAVLEAAARGEGASVRPVFTDERMRDQYPSAGILRSDAAGGVVTYRVLTSWFDAVVLRDYEVRFDGAGRPTVRALGEPVPACRGLGVSLPIMTPDGLELAGRDERSGTTKLFGLGADGRRCDEVLDLGVPTTKVAFAPDGARLAFAVPPTALRDGLGRAYPGLDAAGAYGVFVYERAERRTARVPGSEEALRLVIPEFFGHEGVVFVLNGGERGTSRFRLVPLAGPAG